MSELIFSAQADLREAEKTLAETRNRLLNVQREKMDLESRQLMAKRVESELPIIESRVSSTLAQTSFLETHLTQLKETSTKLLLKVRNIENNSSVTNQMAFTKKEFASGILDICASALIDARLTHEVKHVRDEIVEGYIGGTPTGVSDLVNTIDQSLTALLVRPE